MYKAMIMSEENEAKCREILGEPNIARHCIEEFWWIVWGDEDGVESRGIMPHAVFSDKFQVVGHVLDYMIVEEI